MQEESNFIVYSLEIRCINMNNLCKERCCDREGKCMGFLGRAVVYLFLMKLYVMQCMFWKDNVLKIGWISSSPGVRGADTTLSGLRDGVTVH